MRRPRCLPTHTSSQELCGHALNSLNAIPGSHAGEELRQILQKPAVKVGHIYVNKTTPVCCFLPSNE